MSDILAHLQCLEPYLMKTTVRQMCHIVTAMLMMTGRVTMLGMSRWTDKGGSYRTIQRFFYTAIPWALVFWQCFRHKLLNSQATYLFAGDEAVVTKAGKKTYGLDRFFAGLYGKPVPGLAFFALSQVNVQERRSYPIMVEQQIRQAADKKLPQPKKKKKKRVVKKGKPGRPKGSKNKDKSKVTLTAELQLIKNMILKRLFLINGTISLTYLVLDGHFGNNNALQMTRQCGLQMISKLSCDAALYIPYAGPQNKFGPRRKYGDKIDYAHLPTVYLKQTTVADDLQTDIYQAHVVLFSSALTLAYDQLPLFMVNVAALLLRDFRQQNSAFGVLDLKAHFRGYKYVAETIKLLPEKPDPILLDQVFVSVASLGSIHTDQTCLNSP